VQEIPDDITNGLIVKAQSGFFTVEVGDRRVVSMLRGKLKQGRATGDIAALGDRVHLRVQPDGSGVIDEVEPRRRAITRLDPRPRGTYQQVLLANPDQALFVFACAHPEPRLRMLDRFLVIAEKQGVPAVVVANKLDLVTKKGAQEKFGMYEQAGYPVLYVSAKTSAGVEELERCMLGKISVLAGPSGSGKSSLLNTIRPGLALEVSEIGAVNKGQHTTVVRQLYSLGDGRTYVADTPGWRSLALWDTEPEELDGYFPEIKPLVGKCKFSDCSHVHEAGCAVRAAVANGQIHAERYESYVRLRFGKV
jgi:ribosome biogenesis GTPase